MSQRTPIEIVRAPGFTFRTTTSSGRTRANRKTAELFCESIPLRRLADRYGTPLYAYSSEMIRARVKAFRRAFNSIPHTLCYSVKANGNLSVLKLVAGEGAGFDVVSGGELERVLRAARKAARHVVFSGVGKTGPELELALRTGILLFNVESASELRALAATAARLKKQAPIALRVNPDVSAKTHPYISTGLHKHKFGVPIEEARDLYEFAARQSGVRVAGVSVHIGSQITNMGSFRDALSRVADLVRDLRAKGHDIQYVDAGGGLGISYESSSADFSHEITAYAMAVTEPLQKLGVHLLLEPGRSLVGAAGALLTRVVYRKTNHSKRFLIVDAAMNDLIRPSLYGAHHDIVPVERRYDDKEVTDIVGPVCETGDFFARDRSLPVTEEGDLLAILDAGAYGASLGSNYNTRSRPAEVLVEGTKARLIRRRETLRDQLRLEKL